MPSRQQWDALWRALGAAPPAGEFDRLIAAYSEPHRRYHTLQHLDECFGRLGELAGEAAHPAEVELALWFHDAVYDPRRSDNEAMSAEWAYAAAAALSLESRGRVKRLIDTTRHETAPAGADEKVMSDVDLAILGAPAEKFDEYEAQVREEYAFLPERDFREGRAKIVRGLLDRPSIFATRRFAHAHEAQARANLHRSLARLVRSD